MVGKDDKALKVVSADPEDGETEVAKQLTNVLGQWIAQQPQTARLEAEAKVAIATEQGKAQTTIAIEQGKTKRTTAVTNAVIVGTTVIATGAVVTVAFVTGHGDAAKEVLEHLLTLVIGAFGGYGFAKKAGKDKAE